ncbi:Uncharacterised protein [Neisseria meningitidis]|nr:Uncharacterised protein [Neisseria meningitidis]
MHPVIPVCTGVAAVFSCFQFVDVNFNPIKI